MKIYIYETHDYMDMYPEKSFVLLESQEQMLLLRICVVIGILVLLVMHILLHQKSLLNFLSRTIGVMQKLKSGLISVITKNL